MDILIVLKMILKFGVKHRYLSCREIEIKFPTQRENEGLEVLSRSNQRKIMDYIEKILLLKT